MCCDCFTTAWIYRFICRQQANATVSKARSVSRFGSSTAGAKPEFRGYVPQQEVMRGLHSACIAVLPNRDDADSRYTSPIKLFEYMAAGCAIVASDLPPLRADLAGDEPVWVRPGDPPTWPRAYAGWLPTRSARAA